MRTAFNRIDIVCIAEDILIKAVVVLHRHFGLNVIARNLEIDDRMQRALALVQMLDELAQTALKIEGLLPRRFPAHISQDDLDSGVQNASCAGGWTGYPT